MLLPSVAQLLPLAHEDCLGGQAGEPCEVRLLLASALLLLPWVPASAAGLARGMPELLPLLPAAAAVLAAFESLGGLLPWPELAVPGWLPWLPAAAAALAACGALGPLLQLLLPGPACTGLPCGMEVTLGSPRPGVSLKVSLGCTTCRLTRYPSRLSTCSQAVSATKPCRKGSAAPRICASLSACSRPGLPPAAPLVCHQCLQTAQEHGRNSQVQFGACQSFRSHLQGCTCCALLPA